MKRQRAWILVAAVAVVGLVLGTAWYVDYSQSPGGRTSAPCFSGAGATVSSEDLTGILGTTFRHGAIQAFDSNSTTVLLGGLSTFMRNAQPSDSEPAVAALTQVNSGNPTSQNLTPFLYRYFDQGGVFPAGWNGSAWLLAGQTTLHGLAQAAAVSIQGGRITNLTGEVEPYFQGTRPNQDVGIWIAGWDGKGWLIGGNSSWGASLIYLAGDHITNLSGNLSGNRPGDWVQMVAWNGTGWLIGGQGVLAAWQGSRFTNLLPGTPYASGGVYAIGRAGSQWIIGGTSGQLAIVNGSQVLHGPTLPPGFGAWVNALVPAGTGWWVGGGGYSSPLTYTTQLAFLPALTGNGPTYDASACLPQDFQGGWIQYGASIPNINPQDVLLVGVGGVNATTGTGHGAAVLLQTTAT